MLSNLKTKLLGALNRATEKFFLKGTTPVQRFNKIAPLPQAEDRAGRKHSRKMWQLFKSYDRRSGCPVLTDDKRLRAISNIYGVPFEFVVIWNFNGALPEYIANWQKQRRMKEPNASRNLSDPETVLRWEKNSTRRALELSQRDLLEKSRA